MHGNNIAVIRAPGQHLHFRLNETLRADLPPWLARRVSAIEDELQERIFGRYLRVGNRHCRIAPIRECKIMRMLSEAGYRPVFFDFLPEANPPRTECSLLEYRLGDSLDLRYVNFGQLPLSLHDATIAQETRRMLGELLAGIDIVMLSTTFAFENPSYAALIFALQDLGKKVVVGGSDATVHFQAYLDYGVDLIFRGDFLPDDPSWRKLVRGELPPPPERVTPLRFQSAENKIAFARDIQDHVDMGFYIDGHDGPVPSWVVPKLRGSPVWGIMFSYGCPLGCDFCDTPLWAASLAKSQFTYMTLDHAIAAVTSLRDQGIRVLDVMDDNLLLIPSEYLRELFGVMSQLDLYWNFPNGLQISLLQRKPELLDVLFPRTPDGNRGFNLYWPLESVQVATPELNRTRYRKLTSLDKNIALMRQILERGVRVECAVILLEEYSEAFFQAVAEVYDSIQRETSSCRNAPLRFSVYHPIPLGGLRLRELKLSKTLLSPLARQHRSREDCLATLLTQGTKYFYAPSPIQGVNVADASLQLNWPAVAQAYLFSLMHQVDPANVLRMLAGGRIGAVTTLQAQGTIQFGDVATRNKDVP